MRKKHPPAPPLKGEKKYKRGSDESLYLQSSLFVLNKFFNSLEKQRPANVSRRPSTWSSKPLIRPDTRRKNRLSLFRPAPRKQCSLHTRPSLSSRTGRHATVSGASTRSDQRVRRDAGQTAQRD